MTFGGSTRASAVAVTALYRGRTVLLNDANAWE